MGQGEAKTDGWRSELFAVMLGEHRTRTKRTLLLAGGFLVVFTTIQYANLITKYEVELLVTIMEAFEMELRGPVVVVGLAIIQSYLNKGYVPSVVLAIAPSIGVDLWVITSASEITDYHFDPLHALERNFPEAVALATLGFLVGFGLQLLRTRVRARRSTTSQVRKKG